MAECEAYVRHHIYIDVLAGWLWVAEDSEGELHFPVNASCDALELDTRAAHDLINRDARLTPGSRDIRLPTRGGEQAQTCLRSTEYAWWLALTPPPRGTPPAQRALLIERQRVLMGLAREIMLRGRELDVLPSFPRQRSERTPAPATSSVEASGTMEGHFRCQRCGAPHVIVIDGAGWHVHLGVEVGQ